LLAFPAVPFRAVPFTHNTSREQLPAMNIQIHSLSVALALWSSLAASAADPACSHEANQAQSLTLQVTNLTCEYLTDPLGIDVRRPRFSWQLIDRQQTRGQKQTGYQIVVTREGTANTETDKTIESQEATQDGRAEETDEQQACQAGRVLLWDSGKVASCRSVNNVYAGIPLDSNWNCYWKVRAWDKDGRPTAWSGEARFSVGPLDQADWSGSWIRHAGAENIKHIWYRKNFALDGTPKRAFAHLASIGYHELYVNGRRVGRRVLSPAVSNLEKRVLYVTYDITEFLQPGDNVLGVWTGPGWARADGSYGKGVWEQESVFLCQVNMSDGTSLHSDDTWKCEVSSSENLGPWKGGGRGQYGGEIIDARRHIADWNHPAYDDSHWDNATTYDRGLILSAEMLQPDRKVEELAPVAISKKDGLYTFDMGRNFTGWLEMELRDGKAGQTLKFTTANDPGLKIQFHQESHYIHDADGKGTFRHRFNYMAGRWITVEGLTYEPRLDDVRCQVITNDRRRIGHFECSKPLLNDIYETDLRTYIANTVNGVTMDCPHRERYGYGEITLACAWGCGIPNYDSAAFYSKVVRDWFDVQRDDGFVNTIAPQVYKGAGGTLWSSAPLTVSWEFHKAYGDKRRLREAYEPMKKWLDYLHEHVSDDGVLTPYASAARFLGDWATPHGSEYGNTRPAQLFNNCVYAYNLDIFVRAARALGKPKVANVYAQRLRELRKNAHRHFFNADSQTYIDGRQLSLAFPLYTRITPDELRPAVFDKFVKEIAVNKPYLDTGSPGLPILLKYIVEDVERPDLLYQCLTRREHPSYGYFFERGQTTWPEYWKVEGIASKIHTCYTSIAGYFVKGIGGIRPDPERPGFQSFIIQPHLVGDLTHADTRTESLYGPIVSNWKRTDKSVMLHVEVPPNSQAAVYVPGKRAGAILESDRPAEESPGVRLMRVEPGYIVYDVQSGSYDFQSPR